MVVGPQTTKPELGVLFVHGIGEQRHGETLVHFADPISRWLARWLTQGGTTEAAVGAPDGTGVTIDRTVLVGEDPAHAHLTVESAPTLGLPGRHTWLLAESWWAETFEPPKTTALLLWMLVILPYVTVVQFLEQLRRAWQRPAGGDRRGWGTRPLRVSLFLFFYVCALPLAALGAALVALLLVAVLIPIPQVKARAKKLALLLSNTVGDSFVLVNSAVQFDAMVSRVASNLEWLAERAEHVVVLAHSQGTAVSYAALEANPPPPNLRAFVTVGEGIKKLQLMRALQSYGGLREPLRVGKPASPTRRGLREGVKRVLELRSARFAAGWVGLLGIYAVAYAVPQVLTAVLRLHRTPGPVALTLLVGGCAAAAAVLAIYLLFWARDFNRDPEPVLRGDAPVRWADFYASADPVPNGPLFSDPASLPWLNEREVWNFGSVLRDHTTYTSSEDDFLGCVVAELVRATGSRVPDETRAVFRRARWRGRWRVRWLTLARAGAAAASVSTILRVWKHLGGLGDRIADWRWPGFARRAGGEVVDAVQKLVRVGHPTHDQVGGGLAVLLIGVAGYAVLAAAWSYWQKQDVKRFYQRAAADTDPLGGRELLLFVATLAIEGTIACVVGWTGDYAAAWNWVRDNPLSATAVVVGGAGILPFVLAWLLRAPLGRLERRLIDASRLDREPSPPAPEAAAVAQP